MCLHNPFVFSHSRTPFKKTAAYNGTTVFCTEHLPLLSGVDSHVFVNSLLVPFTL